ncbi:hypothetical protein THAOC_05717, partial [Thalassiosira oceanica]
QPHEERVVEAAQHLPLRPRPLDLSPADEVRLPEDLHGVQPPGVGTGTLLDEDDPSEGSPAEDAEGGLERFGAYPLRTPWVPPPDPSSTRPGTPPPGRAES